MIKFLYIMIIITVHIFQMVGLGLGGFLCKGMFGWLVFPLLISLKKHRGGNKIEMRVGIYWYHGLGDGFHTLWLICAQWPGQNRHERHFRLPVEVFLKNVINFDYKSLVGNKRRGVLRFMWSESWNVTVGLVGERIDMWGKNLLINDWSVS